MEPHLKIALALKYIFLLPLFSVVFSCSGEKKAGEEVVLWMPYNDSAEVAANRDHEIERMRYSLIQSKVLDKNEVFRPLYNAVSKMSEATYNALKPLVLEQDIPTIQSHISSGGLTYEKLALFYLHRIYGFELDNTTTLNTIIALNDKVLDEARALDKEFQADPGKYRHPIFGMPILVKDNINTEGMRTTAGSVAMMYNNVDDAFIIEQLKTKGGLVLGKVNLSEWAYFLCKGCPLGYSALGGQTLNPYGRRIFESGGSSSGSGTSVAANYAVAAIGTETSGSILSPSSQNSVVGLKPTIGLLGRSGIVPISSTLDTPGPMTKNVVDNAILLDALFGPDKDDPASIETKWGAGWYHASKLEGRLLGNRFGVVENLMETDSIYRQTVEKIKGLGAEIIEFTPPEVNMDGFLSILNIDMRNDLPSYIGTYVKNEDSVKVRSIAGLVEFNAADSLIRIPYGQAVFDGILADSTSMEGLRKIKATLEKSGRTFFDTAMDTHRLDAVLSIDNYHAAYAAVAKYPALTVPMGYRPDGEPVSLTFIGKPLTELKLLKMGHAFEKANPIRRMPKNYE